MQKIQITDPMLRTMLNGVHSPGSGINSLGAFPVETVEEMRTALDSLLNGDEGLRQQMLESAGWYPVEEDTVLYAGDEVERDYLTTGVTAYAVVGSVTSDNKIITQTGAVMGYLDDEGWRYRRGDGPERLPAQDMTQIVPKHPGTFILDKGGREYTILTLDADEQIWYDAHRQVLPEDIVADTWALRAG